MPLYSIGRTAIMTDLNLDTGPIKGQLLTGAYSFDDNDEHLDDITAGIIGTPVTLPGTTVTDGLFTISGPVTFSSVPAVGTVSAVLIFEDTGTPSTSRLIGHRVTSASVAANGGDILVEWPDDEVIEF